MSSTSVKSNGYSKNEKVILLFVILLAISIKCILSYYFFKFDNDKLNQATAAKNLVEGFGITIREALASDLSKSAYIPLGKWPPGYSLILAPIYLFIKNLETSTLILQFISVVFFFIVYLILLKQLRVSFTFTCLFILFQGVTFYEDILTSAPTDLLATSFCLFACTRVLEINSKPEKSILSFSFANSISATLRYMYWPVSLIIPLFILWNGIIKKDNTLCRKGWISLLIAVATCLALLIYEKAYVGDTLYLNPTETGIFFSNLLSGYPFTVATILNIDFYAQQMAKAFYTDYTTWTTVFHILHHLILLPLFYFLLKPLWQKKGVANNHQESFIFLVGIISITILVLLAFLSVRISNYYPPPNTVWWTYLSDGRYYIFILVTLPIVFYLRVIRAKKEFSLRKPLTTVFIALILLEITHGLYFTLKISNGLSPKSGSHRLQKQAEPYIKRVIDFDKKNNITTVVASNMPAYAHMGNFHGGIGLFNYKLLNERSLKTSRPVHVLLFTYQTNLDYYKPFIDRPGTKLEIKINNLYCYGTYIMPATQ